MAAAEESVYPPLSQLSRIARLSHRNPGYLILGDVDAFTQFNPIGELLCDHD